MKLHVKYVGVSLGIEEKQIMYGAEPPVLVVRTGASPDDFVAEVFFAEGCVHEESKIVASGGVAVEVDAACGLEHTVKLHESGSHHYEVGGHGVCADELA